MVQSPHTLNTPAAQPALTDLVVRQLVRSVPERDIILTVCEQSGMDWQAAEAFINRVRLERGGEVSRRRLPFMVVISVCFALAGAVLLGTCAMRAWSIGSLLSASSSQVTLALVLAQSGPSLVGQALLGLAMIIGGGFGLGRSLSETKGE